MKKLLSILLLALAALSASAQDDFNPTLPGEPNARYKVTVGVSELSAGSVYGAGSYVTGENITISKSDAWFSAESEVFYRFLYWTLNGEEYSTESSFTYTVGTENVNFVAVYEKISTDDVTSRVYVEISPTDACYSSTTSGQRYFEGSNAYIYCYQNGGFEFLGWYEGDQLISTERYFYYPVGKDDVTLTARFEYNPGVPGEPSSGQTDVDNGKEGDVNIDGVVDALDVEACVEAVLGIKPNKRADINNDNRMSISDIVTLINSLLN